MLMQLLLANIPYISLGRSNNHLAGLGLYIIISFTPLYIINIYTVQLHFRNNLI